MGGKSASHAGLYGVDLEPDPRYQRCCSNIFRPGRMLRDCCLGLLVLFVIAAVIAAMFLLVFFVLKDLTPSAESGETGSAPSNASHSGLDGPELELKTGGRGRAGRREDEVNINDIYGGDDDDDWNDGPDKDEDDESSAEPEPEPTSEPEPEPEEEPEEDLDDSDLEADDHPMWEQELQLFTTGSPETTAEPEPSTTAEPTATAEPEPTATAEPEPEPSSTAEPEPEPTATAEPEPSSTAEPEPSSSAEPELEAITTSEPEPEPSTTATSELETEPATTESELPPSDEQTPAIATTEAPEPTVPGDVIHNLFEPFQEVETELSATTETPVEPDSELATTLAPEDPTTPEPSATPSSAEASGPPTTAAAEPSIVEVEARGFDTMIESESDAPADSAPVETVEQTTAAPTADEQAPTPTAGDAVDASAVSPAVVEAAEPTSGEAPTVAADVANVSETTQTPIVIGEEEVAAPTEASPQSPVGGLNVVAGPNLGTEKPGRGDSGDTFNIMVSDSAAGGAAVGGDEIVTSASLPEWAMTTASPPVVPEGATEVADSAEEPNTTFSGTTLSSLLSGGALAALARGDIVELMEKDRAPEGRSLDSGSPIQALGDGTGKQTFDSCPEGAFSCGDGVCLPNVARCDGSADCRDASDELRCSAGQCTAQQYRCAGQSAVCLEASRLCDGAPDCPAGDDERDCPFAADISGTVDGEKPAPETEVAAPTTEQPAPVTEEAVPATKEAVPTTEQPAPATEEAVLATEETVLATEEAVLATEEAVPATEETVSATDEAVLATEEAVPATEEVIPATELPALATEEAVLATEEAVPATEEPASSTAEECLLGELRCLGGHCISIDQVCDGVAQCPDGADELNCRE